ncbi:regulatory protein RecX [Pseudoflavonifractor capillosus ATCC 29799]|uniref:Regulatory protein RecX n=1 Tax=Pseudoflavonifractor capillosus ATCC 29799 TaxID=411467 RepID=A6NW34_9FIRM|nr:regulatory protein RecX [Pseudoflavonifractor capillosus]EDM99691.1 regulatory protein RecX [Pseudoflavonifractor capillosus ATCC 29799]
MRITKLLPSQRIQGRWLCHLEDGTILRVTENEVACFGLYSGMELTEELREQLAEAVRRGEVKEKALRLLSGRPMSRKELVDKLTARPRDKEKEPIPEELAEEAADRLEELGYLNDAEYARTVARHYAAKGYGERKLRDELWKRGVPREYWDQALEEVQDPTDAMDAFIRRKLMGRTADRETLGKLSAALARRGYRWEDIRAALSRYGETFEDESI